jgi:hypothetical protein
MGKVCDPEMCTGLNEAKTQWFNQTLLLPTLMMLHLKSRRQTSLTKQKFVVTHRYAVLQETGKT